MSEISIRSVDENDLGWVRQLLQEHWGSVVIASLGSKHQADILPAFVAIVDDERVGLVTYRFEAKECEIVSLNSLIIGAGALLVESVKDAAIAAGSRRIWLITSNDNLNALRFYQKIGFALKAVYPDAITAHRKLKPTIPLIGQGGIPLRDEIELELLL